MTHAAVEQYGFQGDRSKNANAFRLPRLVGAIENELRNLGLKVDSYTRGEGLAALGLKSNAKERLAKMAIQRYVGKFGGQLPSNEHSRAAYAQAYRAQVINSFRELRSNG
jgi:hypothetical protein